MEGILMLLFYIIFIQIDLCPIQFVKKNWCTPFMSQTKIIVLYDLLQITSLHSLPLVLIGE